MLGAKNYNFKKNEMKKYKLKKDLPTWKAGTIFWVWEDECLYGLSEDNKPIMVYSAITLINFDLLKNSEWFEEVEEEKSIFELDYGDKYFYIDDFSEVKEAEVEKEYFESFENDLNYGNVFLTKAEAEKELEKRQAIQRIKKYCWENGIKLADRDFLKNLENDRCEISYDVETKEISVSSYKFYNYMNIELLFRSHHEARIVVNNCEKDLKIIFDI